VPSEAQSIVVAVVALPAVSAKPFAGEVYPRSPSEFHFWFPDDSACLAYLERLRWPDGFRCPRCGVAGARAWHLSAREVRCSACRCETSVTAGTIFEGTRLPLTTWFEAVWFITNEKLGTSALALQRSLCLNRYETAWTILHKLRRAMVRPGRDKLSGEVEVDETYVGGAVPGRRGRGALGKAIVGIAVEAHGVGERSKRVASGRMRLARIKDCSEPSLTAFCEDAIAAGSVVYTDHWSGYNGLGEAGFTHHPTNISASGDPAHIAMPRVHRAASLLKRWLLGTHQGGISVRQLDFYLDEFVFRFNRRRSHSRGLLFYRLLEQAVRVDHVPAHEIVGGRPYLP
jgi:transposase-like protein